MGSNVTGHSRPADSQQSASRYDALALTDSCRLVDYACISRWEAGKIVSKTVYLSIKKIIYEKGVVTSRHSRDPLLPSDAMLYLQGAPIKNNPLYRKKIILQQR